MAIVRYQLPEKTNLQTLGATLRTNYTGTNQQRFDFFDVYDYFVANRSDEEQLAWLIFEFEFIDQQYSRMSPQLSKGWIWNSGSQVYTELHKHLGDINLHDRLILLTHLWQVVNEELPLEVITAQQREKKTWPSIEALSKEIHRVIQRLVQVRSRAELNLLMRTIPQLDALKKNIAALYENYHAEKSGKSTNSTREAALTLIEFTSKKCDEWYQDRYVSLSEEVKKENKTYKKVYHIHLGMLLFSLLQVKAEYRRVWPWSPYHSALFREALVAIGYTSLDEIDLEDQIKWLSAFGNFLTKITDIAGDENKNVIEREEMKSVLEHWEKRGLGDLFVEKAIVHAWIGTLEAEKSRPSIFAKTAKSATASAVGYVFEQTVVQHAVVPAVTTTIGGLIAGPMGAGIAMACTPIVAAAINQMASQYVPLAVSKVVTTAIAQIEGRLGQAFAAAAFSLFAMSKEGLSRLCGFYKEVMKEELDVEWARSIVQLPDDIISIQEKQKICKVFGWKLPEPIPTTPIARVYSNGMSITFFDNYDGRPASKSIDGAPTPLTLHDSSLLY